MNNNSFSAHTEMARLNDSQLLVEAVERENQLRRAVSRLTNAGSMALLSGEVTAGHEYSVALEIVFKEYKAAKRWADHYRSTVRKNLRATPSVNDEVSV